MNWVYLKWLIATIFRSAAEPNLIHYAKIAKPSTTRPPLYNVDPWACLIDGRAFGNQKFTITFLFLLAEYGGNWQGLCLWWTLNRQPRNILCWHSQCFILSLLAVGRKFMGCLCRMLDCYMKILIFFFFIFLTGLCLRPISIGLYLTTFFQLLNFHSSF